MAELIDKWEVVSKLITLQNNYTFFKNEWDAERLYREIAKLEIGISKTPGLQVVRCKDCKLQNTAQCLGYVSDYDGWEEWCVNDDDFCSYGERKDNVDS